MRWRILGQVQTWDGRNWVPVRAGKERQLLAILLLHAGQVAERGRLIDQLWEQNTPVSAERLLSHYVWRLRQLPAFAGATLRTAPNGYALQVPPDQTDFGRFAHLVGEARHAGPHTAIERLTEALALWQGPALADTRTLAVLEQAAQRLDAQRIEAMELLAGAQAAAGRHGEAATLLQEITHADPFREEPWRLLMLALDRCGRRPDALLAYQRLWRTWREQLGIEPGRASQDLHRRLLADGGAEGSAEPETQPAVRIPRQLPGPGPAMVGRAGELAELNRLLEHSAEAGKAMLAAVTGAGGVGKTTLALHWANSVAGRFPDGQMFLNLRGFAAQGVPVRPHEAIRMLLRGLNVAPQTIPSELDAQEALWRSRSAGLRLLVIVDNARDAEQIRPLVTGTPGSAFIITSRNRMTGLCATHGAHTIPVGPLSTPEAGELLRARLGNARVRSEPKAAGDIIARCANLPLALAIVAARATNRSATALSRIAADMLASSTLDALHTGDPVTDPRSVFSWSYAALSPGAARLFRLLGLHPGAGISTAAAASAAAVSLPQVQRWLTELHQAHLLSESPWHRFDFHDLLRQYAAELAEAEEDPGERDAALRRMADHYLHSAHAADQRINRDRPPVALPAPSAGVLTALGFESGPEGAKRAQEWFAAECSSLLAMIGLSERRHWDEHTYQLHTAIAHHLFRSGQWIDQITTAGAAVTAADRGGDNVAKARARYHLARACLQLGRHDEAESHLRQALHLTDVPDGELHHVLSWVLDLQSRHDEAFHHARRALELFRAKAEPVGEARALNTIGWFHARLGRYEQAITCCEASYELHLKADHHEGQAAALHSIGFAQHHLGGYARALTCFGDALKIFGQLELRYFQGSTLDSMADTLHAMGRPAEAAAAWQKSLVILEEMRHPAAAGVQAKLSQAPAT